MIKQICISENEWRRPPTYDELVETVNILSDFGISISINQIPKFGDMYGLERWRKKKIKEKLS